MTARSPEPGRIALVRQRRYLVENVAPPPSPGEATLVDLSCLDDDAQGEPLSVLWEHELDACVLKDDGWSAVAEKGFDDPPLFAAYLRTLSWNCVTATDPNLFQAPFRAGIRIDAYQLDPLRKALRLPRVNLFIADDVGLGSKCVVIDGLHALVTSANFTEAAQDRNIELGLLVDSHAIASRVEEHFVSLIRNGFLARLPLL